MISSIFAPPSRPARWTSRDIAIDSSAADWGGVFLLEKRLKGTLVIE